MIEPTKSTFIEDPAFQSLLVACLDALQRGERVDRDALVENHPNYATELLAFLDDRQRLEEVAKSFGELAPVKISTSGEAETVASNHRPKEWAKGDDIRYIGEYEILEEVARGGMGVVFKARQQSLNRVVALKMILAGRFADETEVGRFRREAQSAGRLTHSHIVPIHEIGEHDGRHYFTMDYVDGQSLANVLRDETLAPMRAAELVAQVASAIDYAHRQGTVHRDLKPANVLLDKDGQPHVTDFGLAMLLESIDEESRGELTATGQILGTPSYMSPEQASGKQELVGPQSDIYSLGAILYACLTGRAPFVAESPVDTMLQVTRNAPVSPKTLNPSVPKDLEMICLKCLEKKPADRYRTAGELADDLRRFTNNEPVIARPLPALTRLYRWSDRNLGKTTAIAIAFALMLPSISFLAMGFLMGKWPLPLLYISYGVMLPFIVAPYVLSMLFYTSIIRVKREGPRFTTRVPNISAKLLVILGAALVVFSVAGYVLLLAHHGWNVPKESRWLVLTLFAGIGALRLGFTRPD